ncbi:hypothetical protein PMES_01957 [Profundibacterium mesophilum KAUST100406-0324]|uniref:Uncharacterized protein n=2 Tax=Profundibacterium TaxID=1258570 RepID=A0A921TD35_9RHOB|nr:hypothetical protein PMES_01957 [Profundibacterium mesophilum KAUST100406-0324]
MLIAFTRQPCGIGLAERRGKTHLSDPTRYIVAASLVRMMRPLTVMLRILAPVAVFRTISGKMLAAAMVLRAPRAGMSLRAYSVLMAALFGDFHLTPGLDGFTALSVSRFTIAASIFELVIPMGSAGPTARMGEAPSSTRSAASGMRSACGAESAAPWLSAGLRPKAESAKKGRQ